MWYLLWGVAKYGIAVFVVGTRGGLQPPGAAMDPVAGRARGSRAPARCCPASRARAPTRVRPVSPPGPAPAVGTCSIGKSLSLKPAFWPESGPRGQAYP